MSAVKALPAPPDCRDPIGMAPASILFWAYARHYESTGVKLGHHPAPEKYVTDARLAWATYEPLVLECQWVSEMFPEAEFLPAIQGQPLPAGYARISPAQGTQFAGSGRTRSVTLRVVETKYSEPKRPVGAWPGSDRTADWLAEYTDDPSGIRAFCLRYGIESHLKTAVELAKKCFPSAVRFRIEPRQDPEEDAEWLVLRASVKGGVKEVLKAYDGYIDQWVRLAPPSERGMIRLSYNLVR